MIGPALLLSGLVQPAPTFASDGQVLGPGNNIAGDVFLASGHARINFTNLGDCPAGLPNCFVEIKFFSLCQEFWCAFWDESAWFKVPAGQDFYIDPNCRDGGNKWVVKVRVHWIAPTTHTVRFRGETEFTFGLYPLIPKSLWDVTTSTGFDGGVLITTATGTDQFAGEATLGQSNGYLSGPQTC
jgi:hypothetical protein